MNCDQVFDILTRGPFPTGDASDAAVEAHLARCAECHRLAEALRPALELFEESIPLDQCRELPGYWGELVHAPTTRIAPEPPRTARAESAPPVAEKFWEFNSPRRNAARLTAAIMAGVLLGLVLRTASLSELTPRDRATPRIARAVAPAVAEGSASNTLSAEVGLTQVGRDLLASLQLAPACFGIQLDDTPETLHGAVETVHRLSSASYDQLTCCTNCHTQATSAAHGEAVTRIVRSCAACHH